MFAKTVSTVENNPNKSLIRADIAMQYLETGISNMNVISLPGQLFLGEKTARCINGGITFECCERSLEVLGNAVINRPWYCTLTHTELADLLVRRYNVSNGLGIPTQYTERIKGEYQAVWDDSMTGFNESTIRHFVMAMSHMNRGLVHTTFLATPRGGRPGTARDNIKKAVKRLSAAYPGTKLVYQTYYIGGTRTPMCVLGFSKNVDVKPRTTEYVNAKGVGYVAQWHVNKALDVESFE